MVQLWRPSLFEDFAYHYLLKHDIPHETLSVAEREFMKDCLSQMGFLNREHDTSTHRGVVFARNLDKTYAFESIRKKDDTLDSIFSVGRKTAAFFPVSQSGAKPVIFQYSIPDPFVDDDRNEFMFRFSHPFSLRPELFDLLVFSLYDGDIYPTDFWLICRGEQSILGRTTFNLHKFVNPGDKFVYAFTNSESFAVILDCRVEGRQFIVRLDAYFTRAEGLPYVDSLMALAYKLRLLLRITGQETDYRISTLNGEDVKVNGYKDSREFKRYKDPYHEPMEHSLPAFSIAPLGAIRYRFWPHEAWIAMVAMRPPTFANSVPWLRYVSPWFGYVGHGTLDDDVVYGRRLRFWHIHVLELEHVILSSLVLARVRPPSSSASVIIS